MIFLLITMLVSCVTYLITDFRRYLEIQSLKAFHKAKMEQELAIAYHVGLQEGARIQRLVPYENVPATFNN